MHRTSYKVAVTYNDGKVKTYGGSHVNEEGTAESIEQHLLKHKHFGPSVKSLKVTLADVKPTGEAAKAAALLGG